MEDLNIQNSKNFPISTLLIGIGLAVVFLIVGAVFGYFISGNKTEQIPQNIDNNNTIQVSEDFIKNLKELGPTRSVNAQFMGRITSLSPGQMTLEHKHETVNISMNKDTAVTQFLIPQPEDFYDENGEYVGGEAQEARTVNIELSNISEGYWVIVTTSIENFGEEKIFSAENIHIVPDSTYLPRDIQ